jgi:MoxR-like ATPase
MSPELARRPTQILDPKSSQRRMQELVESVERALRGKREAVELALCAVVARGHLLIEDVPGVGKTTLAQALARSFDLTFARIQFTSDLLPSDILGAQVFDPRSVSFSFRPGPVFAQVVLADELNRAPPRTQSALLEAMADGQVSLDGTTHPLPQPFAVLATQNPREQSGTYPLPDSQLDRFLVRISLGHPDPETEQQILLGRGAEEPVKRLEPVASAGELEALQASAQAVRVAPKLAAYVVAVARATRESALLSGGISTRAVLGWTSAARALALLEGRDFLLPDDLKRLAAPCLSHRLASAGRDSSEADRGQTEAIVRELVERVEVPE